MTNDRDDFEPHHVPSNALVAERHLTSAQHPLGSHKWPKSYGIERQRARSLQRRVAAHRMHPPHSARGYALCCFRGASARKRIAPRTNRSLSKYLKT